MFLLYFIYFCMHETNRQCEASNRLVIGLFLVNAVELAKNVLHAGTIALFSEIPFEHPDLPGVGPIGGNLDFLTSGVLNTRAVWKHPRYASYSKPYLLVVEAKHGSALTKPASMAQLVAQLLTLDFHDP